MSDRRYAPSTARNREPLLAVLEKVLTGPSRVLEIASGTGEHGVFFAARLPHIQWQPTDMSSEALVSIEAHVAHAGLPNVSPPIALDITKGAIPNCTAMVCINMIHISPIAATEALFAAAGRMAASAPLVTYGPYKVGGEHTASSNEAFDASLRSRNPEWGIRDIGVLETMAAAHGVKLESRLAMPANNFTLIWRA